MTYYDPAPYHRGTCQAITYKGAAQTSSDNDMKFAKLTSCTNPPVFASDACLLNYIRDAMCHGETSEVEH